MRHAAGHGISENLFTVDKTGNVVGVVAKSVAKVSEFVWEVTLKDGVKFSDGTAVTGQVRRTTKQLIAGVGKLSCFRLLVSTRGSQGCIVRADTLTKSRWPLRIGFV